MQQSLATPVQGVEQPTTNRLVWVLNRHHMDYTEEFKGELITIPSNNQRLVKMPFLEARSFLGRGKKPAKKNPDGSWLNQPKALYTEEIQDEYERDLERISDHEKSILARSSQRNQKVGGVVDEDLSKPDGFKDRSAEQPKVEAATQAPLNDIVDMLKDIKGELSTLGDRVSAVESRGVIKKKPGRKKKTEAKTTTDGG